MEVQMEESDKLAALEPAQAKVLESRSIIVNYSEVRRTFRLDMLAAALYSAFGVAIVSFPAVLVRKEGADSWIVSLVIAAPSIGLFSTILWSRFTQRAPKMKVVLWGGGAARLSLLLLLLAFNPLIFALVMVVCYILENSKAPAYAMIMQQVYPANKRGDLMGKVRVVASIATVVTAALIGMALDATSYRVVFPVIGLLGFASILVFVNIHYYDEPSSRPTVTLRKLVLLPRTDRRYGSFLLAVFFMGFFNLLGAAIFPLVMVDDLHIDNSFVGIINAAQSFIAIIFYFIWGKYSDRHHPITLLYITFVIGAVIIFIYMVAWTAWPLLIVAILTGISAAGADLATINTSIRFPKEAHDIPHYMALYSTLIGVRGVIAPFLASLLLNFMTDRTVLLLAFIGISLSCVNFYRVQKILLADPYFADPIANPTSPIVNAGSDNKSSKNRSLKLPLRRP
jgi:MFS family permease